MEWSAFLKLLAGPAAVGILWSLLAEYIPSFQVLAPKWKRAVFFVVCMGLSLAATGLGMLTHLYPVAWVALWEAIVAGGVTFASGTMIHIRELPAGPNEPQ